MKRLLNSIMLICLLVLAIQEVNAAWYTDANAVYTFDANNTNDATGYYNGVPGPNTQFISPGIVGAGMMNGTEDKRSGFNITNEAAFDSTTSISYGFWIKTGEATDAYVFRKGAATNQFYSYIYANGSISGAVRTTPGVNKEVIGPDITNEAEYCIVYTYDSSNGYVLWVNNATARNLSTSGTIIPVVEPITVFMVGGGTSVLNGAIDNLFFTNRTMNSSEVAEFCSKVPFGGVPASLTVSLNNSVNGSSINRFSANVHNGTHSFNGTTTTGSVSFNITGTVEVSWINISEGTNATYFNVTQNITVTVPTTVTNSTFQLYISLSPKQLYTNNSISIFNTTNNLLTNQTNGTSVVIKGLLGDNNIRIVPYGNFSMNTTCSMTAPLVTNYCNATGIYDDIFNLSARNGYNGSGINTFSVTLSNTTFGASQSASTTNGSVFLRSLQGYLFNFLLTAPGYANTNVYLPANATQNNYTFNVSPGNSVYLYYFDENNGSVISKNVTTIFENTTYTFTNISRTGIAFVSGLTAGTWTLTSSAEGYNQRVNTITITENSTQNFSVYLGNSTSTVIFSVFNTINPNLVIEGAVIGMYRSVNGTSVLVESHTTDITGRAQFSYNTNTYYSFIVTATGYTTKTFFLNPIIFSSYDIPMSQSNTSLGSLAYSDIGLYYTPSFFYATQENTITFYANSPTAIFTAYNFSINYPGGNASMAGTNSQGDTFTHTFNITGAGIFDKVNITYSYADIYGYIRNFRFEHDIIGGTSNATIISNRQQTYGMGVLERTLIGSIVVIIFGGIATFVAGSLIGGVLGLFIMGFLYYIGFLPLLAVALSILIGFFIIARRSGG